MIARIRTVARREVTALFDHPTGYVLLVVFTGVNAFMFFRQAYLTGEASMRPMMSLLPWLFLFFVPAVAMRTIAEDSRSGVLELVLTQPITELELLLGKFAGAVCFLWVGLALTLPIPIGLALGASLQWGPVVAQYVGAGMLALGLAGVGVWASSLTRSQITAFILAVAVMFVLVLVGMNPLIVGLPPTLGAIAARLGVISHFENIGRGVIDLRDAVYFLSLAGVFLALAYGALLGRKLSRGGAARGRLRLGVAVTVAVLVTINLLGRYINGRLDLTPNHAFTLSKGTRQIVGGLGDVVTIKEFASDELPTSVSLLKRDVDDLLRDLRSAGHGNIRILVRDPSSDAAARSDAASLGIQPVQFNVVGSSSLQVKDGYLGLAIQYQGKSQAIPFVQSASDLEYRIAAAIRALTRAKKPVVALFNDISGPYAAVQGLQQGLSRTYQVRNIVFSDTTHLGPEVRALILLGSPDSLSAPEVAELARYFGAGGSALVLSSGMQLNQRMPIALPHRVGWNVALARFGVSIPSNMAYDLAANEIIPVSGSGGQQVLARYPFFLHAQSTASSVVNQQVDNIMLTWPSSVDTTHVSGFHITPLFITTRGGGVVTGEASIQPTRDFPQTDLGPKLLAVQVAPADSNARGRVIVVGNSDFVSDPVASRSPSNMDFALNAVDWLAQDEALISIRAKDRNPPTLAFTSTATRDGVKYFNVVGVPLCIIVAGLLVLASRRRRTREPYTPVTPGGAA